VKENADFYQNNERRTASDVIRDTQFMESEARSEMTDNVENYFKFVQMSDKIAAVENRVKTFKQ
jgi:hypothetical protein